MSRDCDIALQPRRQSKTLSQKKKKVLTIKISFQIHKLGKFLRVKLASEHWTRSQGWQIGRDKEAAGPRSPGHKAGQPFRKLRWTATLWLGLARTAREGPGQGASPSPSPPGGPDWTEASARAHPQALSVALPRRSLAAHGFALRRSSFALTKASLGAFLAGAILPDSMLSSDSSSVETEERGQLEDSSLRPHPCGEREEGSRRRGYVPAAGGGSFSKTLARGKRRARAPVLRRIGRGRESFPVEPAARGSTSQSCSAAKGTKRENLTFEGVPHTSTATSIAPFGLRKFQT
ncbi:hypothetical protein AAY473_039871 [Plecturocebus cupreus]